MFFPRAFRRLLLIGLDWSKPGDPPLSLGFASILAKLRADKLPVIPRTWVINHPDFTLDAPIEFVRSHATSGTDVAIGAYVWNEELVQSLLRQLRDDGFRGKIILGGPQITYTRSELSQHYPQADTFIRGYAEEALAQLMRSDPPLLIPGVHHADTYDDRSIASPNLHLLPSPYLTGFLEPQSFMRWETQRGCIHCCSYCQHRLPRQVSDHTRRFHSAERILEEARWMAEHPGIQDIHVVDPTFNSGPHYLEVLEALYDHGFKNKKLALQCRFEMVKPEFLDVVERLHKEALVVLEFGLQTIHREEQRLINRPTNMKKVEEILQELRRRRIEIEVSLIYGLPNQTLESFKQTIAFCREHGVNVIWAYPLMLCKGTELYDRREEFGLVVSDQLSDPGFNRIVYGISHVVSSPSFTYGDWEQMAAITKELNKCNQRYILESRYDTQVEGRYASILQNGGFFKTQGYTGAIEEAGHVASASSSRG